MTWKSDATGAARGPVFHDRRHAGRVLASVLGGYRQRSDVLVLALPRGGVPVGFEVAEALHAPLEVFIVRKLGAPGHEEYAIGAIASGGVRVLNQNVLRLLHLDEATVEESPAPSSASSNGASSCTAASGPRPRCGAAR
jgi:putative phosphoribosyl transferase